MSNKENFYITVTDAEMPDFFEALSAEEIESLKKNVLAKINQDNKPKKNNIILWRRKIISLISAAVLLLFSTITITAITPVNKIPVATEPVTEAQTEPKPTETTKKETNPQLNDFSSDEDKVENRDNFVPAVTTPSPTKPSISYVAPAKTYVKLNHSALEGYSVIDNQDGWYSFEYADEYTLYKNFDCQVIWRDTGWSRDIIQELGLERSTDFDPEYEQFFLGDHKAMYVEYPYGSLYSHQLFVSYPEYNYVFTILCESGFDKESVINLGNTITLESATEANGSCSVNLVDYFAHYSPDYLLKGTAGKIIDATTIKKLYEATEYGDCSVTVENVLKYNNVNHFRYGFTPAVTENYSLFTDEWGNLTDFSRNIVVCGNGFMTPKEKITLNYNMTQTFCTLQIRITNNTDKVVENLSTDFPLVYVTENENGVAIDKTGYQRPEAFELCQENSLPKYNSQDNTLTLEPYQQTTVLLGYFVDTDLCNKFILSVDDGNNYIDLR